MAHAHGQGVIHRDLKPANVFLCDDGRVKVLDFGLAHAFGQRRQAGGTPAYMAPEQGREAPEDERTDVFALGVILHQLLAGSLPFESGEEVAGSRRAPPLEVSGAPALGELVGRMLEKDPLRRPRDAGRVLAAFERAMAEIAPRGAGPVRARRHPRWRVAALLAAGAALGFGGLVAWDQVGRLRSRSERIPVVVADVVNDTGEKELDVLSGLLVTSLEQSRRLSVLTQARVLDIAARAGRRDATRVDEVIGREVGKARGARALLLPAVRRFGGVYFVDMRVVDPLRDEHLFTVSERATTKEALVDLLDRLSDRTRLELKESPADLERSRIALGAAMTRSMEAYGHYALGMALRYRDGVRAAAMREQEKAVEIDPQFAAAHAQLGYMAIAYGAASRAQLERAYEGMERMPEKERLLIRLQRAGYPLRDPEEQVRLAFEMVRRFPEDKAEVAIAASYLAVNERRDDAERTLRDVLRLDPGYAFAVWWLADVLRDRGHAQEAVEVARRAVASHGNASNRMVLAGALEASGANREAAAEALAALAANDGQSAEVAEGACDVLSFLGRGPECLPFLEHIATAGLNRGEQFRARCKLAELLAFRGRLREARTVLGSIEEGDPRDMAWILQVGRHRTDATEALAQVLRMERALQRRWYLAFLGKVEESKRVTVSPGAGELGQVIPSWSVEGLMLASEGRHSEAADAYRRVLDAARREREAGISPLTYLLAEALLAAGRSAEAAAVEPLSFGELRRVVWGEARIHALHAANYPRLALVRARALEQLGRRGEAVKELDGLLDFWKEADDDLPLLVEAKSMRKRLAAR